MPTAQLPDIKLTKVGKQRKRKKRGGIAWFFGGGRGAFLGGMGAEGSGGVLSALESLFGPRVFLLLPKLIVAALLSSMAVGAYSIGHFIKNDAVARASAPAEKPQVFVRKERNGSPLGEGEADIAKRDDSVGLIMQEARDGKTAAQRAAEAAAAAKAAADAEAKAKADADAAAAAKAKADDAAAAAAAAAAKPDAAALAAAQTAQMAAVKAPLSGFKSSKAGDAAAGASLTGWGFGGADIGGHLSSQGAPTGMSRAMVAAQPVSRTSSPLGRTVGGGRGLGFNQLSRASQLSGAATKTSVAETASQNAQNAFQPPVGGDSAIASPPGSPTDSPAGTSSSGAGSSGGGGGGSDGSTDSPGNTNTNTGLGMCETTFPSGGFVQSPTGGCVCPPGQDSDGSSCAPVHSNNATPWQPLVNTAKQLIYAVAALLAIASAIALIANSMDLDFGTGEIVRQAAIALCAIAAVLSAIVLMLGTSISGYGGEATPQGTFFQVMGGIMTAAGAYAAYQYEQTDPLQWAKNVSIPGWSVDIMPIATAGLGAVAGGAAAAH